MNALSPQKPLMIVMTGLPGSGKSFFADQFAETFKAPLISADKLRQIVAPSASFSREENQVIHQLTVNQLGQVLKTQKTVIFDGLANGRSERAELSRMAKAAGYRLLIIWVQVDEASALRRSVQPNRRTKHFDSDKTPLTPELFEQFKKRFMPPLKTDDFLVISGKHTYATQAKVVLKKIVEPRSVNPIARPQSGQDGSDVSQNTKTRNIIIR
ncbi:MAG TPA: ATP-binding protein [Candidatus Saccharimonadales bacterium]|nr:ATP-binding protein [Candidatus Saccharimonadales bacterium]